MQWLQSMATCCLWPSAYHHACPLTGRQHNALQVRKLPTLHKRCRHNLGLSIIWFKVI